MNEKVAPLRLKREKVIAPVRPDVQARNLPIASVLVDTGLLHLDDEFDFLVPEELSDVVVPGSLVWLTFNRKRTQGVVIARKASSSFQGQIRFISELIKPFPVLAPEILQLATEIKRYYGGNRWDVLRFALPALSKKSGSFEKVGAIATSNAIRDDTHRGDEIPESLKPEYPESFWQALSQSPKTGRQVRAYWSAPPAHDPFRFLERLLRSQSGSAILLLPDQSDVERMADLIERLGFIDGQDVTIWHSNLKRREREERFLSVLHGNKRVVIGVRSAILLPLSNPDLIILWDEGSDSFSEQRAPYFHAREVAIMRSHIDKTHLVIGGYSPSLMAADYINRGYLTHLAPHQSVIKNSAPTIRAITNRAAPEQSGRFPTIAWQVLRRGLEHGPVIVQSQLRGYIQALSCSRCLNIALCTCGGKLIASGSGRFPECFLCGNVHHNWSCTFCSNRELRNSQIGDERIVEELGRAFPNQLIILSNAAHRIPQIAAQPAIVVATPGAEPFFEPGYTAGVITNSQLTLQRATLNAEEETRRRWFAFASLLRPRAELFIDCDYGNRNIQTLVRWDGVGAGIRELFERVTLSLPPFTKAVEIRGIHEAVGQVIRELPGEVLVSAPRPTANGETMALIRIASHSTNVVLNEIFRRVRAQSARGFHVPRVRIDPISF